MRRPCLLWLHAALLLAGVSLFLSPGISHSAMRPEDLLLVANKAVLASLRLAGYYAEKRGVPLRNIVTIETSHREQIDRDDYEKEIAAPLRRFLAQNDPGGRKFQCLVLFQGIPLRVGPGLSGLVEEARSVELRVKRSGLQARTAAKDPQKAKTARDEIARIDHDLLQIQKGRQGASVDSELALVMESGHALDGWLPNRYFAGFRGKPPEGSPSRVLATCRLDGPTEAAVRRVIDDSLFAENRGLAGKAYFDARWPVSAGTSASAYAIYDRAIHEAATIVEKSGRMPVVLDEVEALFPPGSAPNAALYCGWYSLGKYVDAFSWVRGAVGFHVASSECTTLRAGASTVWCKVMLEKGVAATLGPVGEPYLQSFPAPEVFFGCLLSGRSLLESYTISNPFWSWQMVLIGDPLYRPFRPLLERK